MRRSPAPGGRPHGIPTVDAAWFRRLWAWHADAWSCSILAAGRWSWGRRPACPLGGAA